MSAKGLPHTKGRVRRRRRLFTLVAALPVLGTLIVSVLLLGHDGASVELGCWLLPNGRVLVVPGDAGCPLRPHEQIRRVEIARGVSVPLHDPRMLHDRLSEAGPSLRVAVMREGAEHWVDVPVRHLSTATRAGRVATGAVVAGALLAIPLFLLWRSTSRAAVPLVLFYSATTVVVVTLICGRHSEWLTRASLLALIGAPAMLAHLSFVLPRERNVLREAPNLAALPYLTAGFLAATGWFALDRNPLLWPPFMYLLLFLTGGAWLILILSCAFAIRESTSALERARARLLCFGALLLPALPTWMATRDAAGPAVFVTAYLWLSAVLIPLPIGLAISRYNLFNLGWDVRHWVGRLVYLGGAAVIVTLILEASYALAGVSNPLRDPGLMWLASFACVAAIEPLRGRMLGFLESVISPRLSQLQRLRDEYIREMAELREGDSAAHRLAEVLREALTPRSGCIFLFEAEEWRPVHPFGEEPPVRADLAAAGSSTLGGRRLLHLALATEEEEEAYRSLLAEGIEVAAAVENGGERFGMILLEGRESRAPYTGVDLDFVATAASQTAIALHNAKLAAGLAASERSAATGQLALALAHDFGKELDWVSRLVRRLPKLLDDRRRLERDIDMIQEFTAGLAEGLNDFLGSAAEAGSENRGFARFDDLVERATRQMSRVHGADRIAQSIDPATRNLLCHENLGRVLANLLDNALLATPDSGSVHLFSTLEEDWIRMVVLDRGSGISEEVLRKAFEPGFSTRLEEGGSGIGLTVARDTVAALGGSIQLAPEAGGGTRATVRLPVVSEEAR